MYGHQYFRKYIVLKTKSHRKEKAVGQNTDKITQWRNNKCAWWGAVRLFDLLFGPMARTSFTTDDRRWNSHSGKELEKHLCIEKQGCVLIQSLWSSIPWLVCSEPSPDPAGGCLSSGSPACFRSEGDREKQGTFFNMLINSATADVQSILQHSPHLSL